MIGVGLALAPSLEWLALCEPLLADIDYASVTPETLWRDHLHTPNGFWRAFFELKEEGLPFVAHSVGYSMGSAEPDDRRARTRASVARDQAAFGFRWWTDHASLTTVAGENLALPLPVPFTTRTAAMVRARLEEMRTILPTVGIENSAQLFLAGSPLDEPGWLADAIGGNHLLLDLHNLHVMAENFGFDPERWLAAAPLDRVLEVHLAGGSAAPEGWGGRPLRLDSHDAAVPEAVWALLRSVVPRCPNLRGVTLERMEGSVAPGDVQVLRGELARLRRELA